MGGSISVKNTTDFPLLISLEQLTPLYWELIQPGQTFFRKTGAVHFTVKARVASSDDINVLKECVLPIGAVSIGSVGLAVAAGMAFIGTAVAGSVVAIQTAVLTQQAVMVAAAGAIISIQGLALINVIVKMMKNFIQEIKKESSDKWKNLTQDGTIPINDAIANFLQENMKQSHCIVKQMGYYAGYDHKLKISGGINLQNLKEAEYIATDLKIENE